MIVIPGGGPHVAALSRFGPSEGRGAGGFDHLVDDSGRGNEDALANHRRFPKTRRGGRQTAALHSGKKSAFR